MDNDKGECSIYERFLSLFSLSSICALYQCVFFINNIVKQKAEKSKKPKYVKQTAELISPNLLACKIETKQFELPPALRKRSIQLQALESKTLQCQQPTTVKVLTVDNELRNRKRSQQENDTSYSGGYSTSDEENVSDDAHFETYLVVEFSPNIQRKTLHWIVDKIRKKTSHGGAGLLIRREPQIK